MLYVKNLRFSDKLGNYLQGIRMILLSPVSLNPVYMLPI